MQQCVSRKFHSVCLEDCTVRVRKTPRCVESVGVRRGNIFDCRGYKVSPQFAGIRQGNSGGHPDLGCLRSSRELFHGHEGKLKVSPRFKGCFRAMAVVAQEGYAHWDGKFYGGGAYYSTAGGCGGSRTEYALDSTYEHTKPQNLSPEP
jgi:hypothetical protein